MRKYENKNNSLKKEKNLINRCLGIKNSEGLTLISQQIRNKKSENVAIYLRAKNFRSAEKLMRDLVENTKELKNINLFIYIDIGFGKNINNKALDMLKNEIEKNIISKLIIKDISEISKKLTNAMIFLKIAEVHNTQVISIDKSVEMFRPQREL